MGPHLTILAVTLSLFSAAVLADQAKRPLISQSNTIMVAEANPNTTAGLHQLLNDLLEAAKNDDHAKLRSRIEKMEIPNYDNWFTVTFGQEMGRSLADQYGKSLRTSEIQFEMLWAELAKQAGEISIGKVDTVERYGPLPGLPDEYKAEWKKTDDSIGPDRQPIGVFYYVNGRFRLNGFSHDVRVLSTDIDGPVRVGKLSNRVQPIYPGAARKLGIQGTVALNVIVHKDGTVTVQNVGAGHPLLAPAAVEAVQQWRYEPTTVGGEAVEIQAKVHVTFALGNQPK